MGVSGWDLTWSDAAIARHKHRSSAQHMRRVHMQQGPQLEGHLLKIPGERGWYSKEAVDAWKKVGFRWQPNTDDLLNGGGGDWVRDVRRSLGGKLYRPEVWLRSVREKFYSFYPELVEEE